MSPNLRKPQPNLSKPSEGQSFNAERKPTNNQTNPLRNSLNLTGERELGTVGGIKATGKLTVGVDNLIGQQGIDIEIDATNRSAGFGAGIGSTKGKLGVNIGGKIGYDEEGKISIKSAEAGINIGGFGGSASIDEDEGVRGSISVGGAKIEIGIGKDGKKSVSLCYGVPGGELCVTFEPNESIKTPSLSAPSPTNTNIGFPSEQIIPLLEDSKCYHVVFLWHVHFTSEFTWKPDPNVFVRASTEKDLHGDGVWVNNASRFYATEKRLPYGRTPAFLEKHEPPNVAANQEDDYPNEFGKYKANFKAWALLNDSMQILIPNGYRYSQNFLFPWHKVDTGAGIKAYIAQCRPPGQIWDISAYEIPCNTNLNQFAPERITPSSSPSPSPSPSPINKIQLPNYPQHFKRMNCCDKVEEIYKYLGIAKLKRNGFPFSNAFLAPGGTGNTKCVDFYDYMQASIRMLANGLILNPKSKPLGSEWQNANATAWASAMYEMMAESMSDGNSTQRFEVAAIMQLTQMMATLAENGRKIEFVVDAIGIEPLPVAENVPVCFTIYQCHKGFGKKEPKKFNVSKLKTDNDVENVLGKMLNPSLIPITAWKFKPGQISIIEALKNNG